MNKKKIPVLILLLLAAFVFITCNSTDNTPPFVGEDIMTLTPMKDQFAAYFDIGNIYPGLSYSNNTTNWNRLERHYNVVTAENFMKPSYLTSSKGSYNFTGADNFVNTAISKGFKVVGHTILWHSQNAGWMTAANCDLDTLKSYVTAVADNFKNKIYSWDVLNEVFPDPPYSSSDWKQAMRGNNPWYANIGPDFVYEGFLAARLADPNAILYYNDYNTDIPAKATMIRDMVRDVNARYAQEYPSETRKLIEGIGMQEHHNTNVQAGAVRATIDLFRPLGVKLSVTELDVLAQGYSSAVDGQGAPASGNNLSLQAQRYGEYFRVYLDNSDIIERVTFWGITDNQSWRSRGQPLIFDSNGKAKPAYYSVIGTLR